MDTKREINQIAASIVAFEQNLHFQKFMKNKQETEKRRLEIRREYQELLNKVANIEKK